MLNTERNNKTNLPSFFVKAKDIIFENHELEKEENVRTLESNYLVP